MKEKEQSESRRAFLKGAAAGAGAGAVAAFVSTASAQSGSETPAAEVRPADTQHGAFFNQEQATAVAVFVERLMPGAPDKPGATDADVLNYIDLALAGAYADQQHFYRRGLIALDAYSRSTHGESFAGLDAEQQDEVISALEDGSAEGFEWPSAQAFFQTLRTHTMEGMFADPIYGGNKDFAGWRLVGFPGAQFTYTPAEVTSTEPFSRAPIIGLQSQATRRG